MLPFVLLINIREFLRWFFRCEAGRHDCIHIQHIWLQPKEQARDDFMPPLKDPYAAHPFSAGRSLPPPGRSHRVHWEVLIYKLHHRSLNGLIAVQDLLVREKRCENLHKQWFNCSTRPPSERQEVQELPQTDSTRTYPRMISLPPKRNSRKQDIRDTITKIITGCLKYWVSDGHYVILIW